MSEYKQPSQKTPKHNGQTRVSILAEKVTIRVIFNQKAPTLLTSIITIISISFTFAQEKKRNSERESNNKNSIEMMFCTL